MKDCLGTEIEAGDIILSSATREGGHFRVGKVTELYGDGSPRIKAPGKKWVPGKGYVPTWYNGRAGSNVLVLAKGDDVGWRPEAMTKAIYQDWDADVPVKADQTEK